MYTTFVYPTFKLCVSYGSQQKTTIISLRKINWLFYNRDSVLTVRYELNSKLS
jgi:hypothetical protein